MTKDNTIWHEILFIKYHTHDKMSLVANFDDLAGAQLYLVVTQIYVHTIVNIHIFRDQM